MNLDVEKQRARLCSTQLSKETLKTTKKQYKPQRNDKNHKFVRYFIVTILNIMKRNPNSKTALTI